MLRLPGLLYRWDWQKLNHMSKQTQTSNKKRWPQQQHWLTPLLNKPQYSLRLCYMFNLQYPLLSTNYTRKLVYPLRTNCPKSLSTSTCTLQTFTQQETVTHCLLFISWPIYLHNLSPHTSSQPITSHIYRWLLYLLTNQIAHQGFWI